MCGIAGYKTFNKNLVNPNILKSMGEVISHRGPDDDGIWYANNIGFAHKRLSILDLSKKASQPMKSSCKRFIICYNGEIYNFKELRTELLKLGHKFLTNSDTEVLLASWKEWGVNCLTKLNGMFAFALYDNLTSNLHLCRDRYGIKPLYFYHDKNIFAFGSEIKALLVNNDVRCSLDLEAVYEYFTFQNIFTNKTFFKNIKLLEHGTHITLTKDGNLIKTRWWDYNFEEPSKILKKSEYLEELDLLFKKAIKRQLISDVSVGSYLSGELTQQ